MRMRTRAMTLAALPLLVLLASTLPAAAVVQLIHMSNGKILKAESVVEEGDWLMATLEGGSTIGFPLSEVDLVEEDPLGRDDAGAPLNVVTSGRELPPRASFPSSNRTSPLDRANLAAARAAQQERQVAAQQLAAQNPGAAAEAAGAGAVDLNAVAPRRSGFRVREDD